MKPWFLSKTILFHALTLAGYVATYLVDHDLATRPEVLRGLVMAQAVVGFVLRFFTDQGIGKA